MKIKYKVFFSMCITVFLISSCVPLNQFTDLKNKSDDCESERSKMRSENEKLSVENKEFEARLEVMKKKLAGYDDDSLTKGLSYATLSGKYENLQRQYESLQKSQDELISGSNKETSKILTELQKSQNNLQTKENELLLVEKNLNSRELQLNRLSDELAGKDKRLRELEDVLQRKDAAVIELKQKISEALLGFENQGLSVTQKNGMVYVSLDEKLLFKSGSTEVDPKGKTALKKLAEVLVQNKDINILIEGHTDDVPYISDERIKDNWDLSVLRATSIVRIIMENKGIEPKRLIASGRGKYLPVDTSKTKDGRQKNRRTEIILSPKLDELYEILENN